MIECKLTLTTKCGARCITCPSWQSPAADMDLLTFKKIWEKINESPHVSKIILNNVGDLYNHPDHLEILKHIESTKRTFVSMTTNAKNMDYIPAIDELIISFNGGTRETYNKTTGLEYDEVLENIQVHSEEIRQKIKTAVIHCLIYEENQGTELSLVDAFTNFPGGMVFPGIIRFSYKYDNQFKEDRTLAKYRQDNKIYCDYLNKISIHVDGSVIMCAHDFRASVKWGNLVTDSVYDILRNVDRELKRAQHMDGEFFGLCKECNHNMPAAGRVYEALLR